MFFTCWSHHFVLYLMVTSFCFHLLFTSFYSLLDGHIILFFTWWLHHSVLKHVDCIILVFILFITSFCSLTCLLPHFHLYLDDDIIQFFIASFCFWTWANWFHVFPLAWYDSKNLQNGRLRQHFYRPGSAWQCMAVHGWPNLDSHTFLIKANRVFNSLQNTYLCCVLCGFAMTFNQNIPGPDRAEIFKRWIVIFLLGINYQGRRCSLFKWRDTVPNLERLYR